LKIRIFFLPQKRAKESDLWIPIPGSVTTLENQRLRITEPKNAVRDTPQNQSEVGRLQLVPGTVVVDGEHGRVDRRHGTGQISPITDVLLNGVLVGRKGRHMTSIIYAHDEKQIVPPITPTRLIPAEAGIAKAGIQPVLTVRSGRRRSQRWTTRTQNLLDSDGTSKSPNTRQEKEEGSERRIRSR
jgi:hypothetical protein